jgi:hypothetical protein
MRTIGSNLAADDNPQTLTEMFLVLLEDRFPWLGTDASANGADVVEQLSDLHQNLIRRAAARRRRQESPHKS